MAKRLQDLLNQDQNNGFITMAELDALEAAQRGQPIGQIPGSFGSGQGSFQRSGGNRVDLTSQGWQDTETQQMMAPTSDRPNQDLPLDYANPLDYGGAKGYRIKGDSSRALLNDGRIVDLVPGRQEAMRQAKAKAEAAQLDMDLKRADLAKKTQPDWQIDMTNGVAINKNDPRQVIPLSSSQGTGASGQIVPGNNDERLAAGYGQRMVLADELMRQIGSEGYQTTGKAVAESVPLIGGYLGRKVGSDKQGQFSQAQADWVRAKLRKESGAAIGADEMEKEISTYFPMPGDSAPVIAQKAEARRVANEAMKMAAGRAGGAVTGIRPAGGAAPSPALKPFDADKEARYQDWKRSQGM